MSQICEAAPALPTLDHLLSRPLEPMIAQIWPPNDGHHDGHEEVSTLPLPLPNNLLPPSYSFHSTPFNHYATFLTLVLTHSLSIVTLCLAQHGSP